MNFKIVLKGKGLRKRYVCDNFLNAMILLKWANVEDGVQKGDWPSDAADDEEGRLPNKPEAELRSQFLSHRIHVGHQQRDNYAILRRCFIAKLQRSSRALSTSSHQHSEIGCKDNDNQGHWCYESLVLTITSQTCLARSSRTRTCLLALGFWCRSSA